MGQNIKSTNHYLGGDSSKEASISLPLRAISSGIIVFSVAFLVSCLTASIVTPVQNSDAAQIVQASIDDSGYYANVTSSDVVNLDLIATQDGAYAIAHDTVTTTTNSATGYKLYISADSNVANSNRLNLSGDKTSDYYLSPSTGTTTSPTTLADNTWGYSLTTLTGNNNEVTSASNFIGLPLLSSENLLHAYSSAATSGNSVDVYYGIKANTALPTGIYTATVVYTVVAEGSPAAEGKVALSSYESTSKSGGNTITISTGLYTSSLDLGTVSVLIGDQTCSNLTQVSTQTGEVKLSCTVPAQTDLGDYDVTVSIPKFEKTYTLEDGFHYYIPWENMTYMQDMTSYACNKVATPSAFTNGDTSPSYSYGNGVTEAQIQSNPSSYWTSSVLNDAIITNINTNVPEISLEDARDGETYRVRKLADGNCWMTENLRLTWSANDEIETAKGNIWNPHYSTETSVNTYAWYNDSDSEIQNAFANSGFGSEYKPNFVAAYHDHSYNASDYQNGYTSAAGRIKTLDNSEQQIGVFYNWKAATAGTGVWDSTEAEDSICPTGWQLPNARGGDNEKNWYILLYEVYGKTDFNRGDRSVSYMDSSTAEKTPSAKDYHTHAMIHSANKAPFGIIFAGMKSGTSGSLDSVGIGAYLASKFSVGKPYLRDIDFASNGIFDGQYRNDKGNGMSVRCVSQ